MWGQRSRKRKAAQRNLAEHRATLAEIEARLRAAQALHAEIKRWPSPLACWLILQAGQGQPIPRWNPVGQPRELRLDLVGRGLPIPTRSMRRFR